MYHEEATDESELSVSLNCESILPILPFMNPDAKRWHELAVYDLGTAEAMLAAGRYLYVLFCCQQAIEKHLKGLIVERCAMFPPRTHDLAKLAYVAKVTPDDKQDLFLRTLTKYYVGTRYPEEVHALADEATRELATRLLIQTKDPCDGSKP
ncbi:MAG TPA: HEPN domain-containing protein [Nitrospira sp.]|nr:HEPN domain-containing protein [Nitrospira sp.]